MYLTDLTDAQKEYIKGTILNENWRSKYDFFLMLDAIIYIDVSGCQWRLLPAEYPKWQTVAVSFTPLPAPQTGLSLVCRLLLGKKKKNITGLTALFLELDRTQSAT